MQLSIVEEFDKRLAEMITGRNDVERMLSIAEQIGDFLKLKEASGGKNIYTIRLPLRRCMIRRLMREYPQERWKRLYYNAGLYYELEDDTPNALKMYEACERWNELQGFWFPMHGRTLPAGTIMKCEILPGPARGKNKGKRRADGRHEHASFHAVKSPGERTLV